MSDRVGWRRPTRCSFCGKDEDEVRKLIAGPGVYICDRCVELCVEALREGGISLTTNSVESAGRDASQLTRFDFKVANLLVRGMGVEAIGWCLMRPPRSIEFHVKKIWDKLDPTLGSPPEALRRQDLYAWLSSHGQLWTNDEVEAIVGWAIAEQSGLDSVRPPDSFPRHEREFIEKELARQRAMLEEARQAVSMSLPEDNN